MKRICVALIFCALFQIEVRAGIIESSGELHRAISYTDGNGFFSYSFYGTTNVQFKFTTLGFEMDTTLIDSIESPTGWIASNSTSWAQWFWTNDIPPEVLGNDPVVFVLHCSTSAYKVNDQGYAAGEASVNGDWAGAGGYQGFDYFQPIPEPSTCVMMILGSLIVAFRRYRSKTSIL